MRDTLSPSDDPSPWSPTDLQSLTPVSSLPSSPMGALSSSSSLSGLMLSGLFAVFLAVTGSFLPHDVAFLGMQPQDLCNLHQCRLVHFMFHDRVSFGGTLFRHRHALPLAPGFPPSA